MVSTNIRGNRLLFKDNLGTLYAKHVDAGSQSGVEITDIHYRIGAMTARPPAAAESTPRRGFGLARLVLRAVGAARAAVRSVGRRLTGPSRPRRAPRRPAARPLPQRPGVVRWLHVPMAVWRAFAPARLDAWLARQTPASYFGPWRRFHLATTAVPATVFATGHEGCAGIALADRHATRAGALPAAATHHHRPPPPLLAHAVGHPTRIAAFMAFQLPTISAPMVAPSLMSVRRDRPRHMTVFPGGGSLARAR